MQKKYGLALLMTMACAFVPVGQASANQQLIPPVDTTLPTVDVFTLPATSSSLTVPILALSVSDNVGVTGWRVTGSPKPPRANSKGWYKHVVDGYNYTFFETADIKKRYTLYAWAKDAAGNVSLAKSAFVDILQTDTVKPVVTGFTVDYQKLPTKSHPRGAKVLTFTAQDNVGVTGYLVTLTPKPPLAGAWNWSPTPTRQTLKTSRPVKKFYAWVKDAAGNVSLPKIIHNVLPQPAVANKIASADAELMFPGLDNGGMQKYSYDPTESPVVNADPALAMPIGVGPVANGGDTVNLEVLTGQFDSAMDVTLTLHAPTDDADVTQVYTLNGTTGEFEPAADNAELWHSGVSELNEMIWEGKSTAEFVPGTYLVTLQASPQGQADTLYSWTTSFTIK